MYLRIRAKNAPENARKHRLWSQNSQVRGVPLAANKRQHALAHHEALTKKIADATIAAAIMTANESLPLFSSPTATFAPATPTFPPAMAVHAHII